MKKIITKALKNILIIIIIYLSALFLYETYQKYDYINECISKGRTKNWCEETWWELRMME